MAGKYSFILFILHICFSVAQSKALLWSGLTIYSRGGGAHRRISGLKILQHQLLRRADLNTHCAKLLPNLVSRLVFTTQKCDLYNFFYFYFLAEGDTSCNLYMVVIEFKPLWLGSCESSSFSFFPFTLFRLSVILPGNLGCHKCFKCFYCSYLGSVQGPRLRSLRCHWSK